MGAYDELASGQLGSAGTSELYRIVAAVARRRGFPPPSGYTAWTTDAVMEAAHDFLTGPRGLARLTQLHVKATSDDSFRALLYTAVLNHFRSIARQTSVGRLVRRLNDVLADDDRFVRLAGGAWQLREEEPAPTSGSEARVEQALWATDVNIVRYRAEAKHQSTGASAHDFAKLAEAAIRAAGGPLHDGELGKLIGHRLGLRELPATVPIDDSDGPDAHAAALGERDRAGPQAVAAGVWAELTDSEKDVLARFGDTVEELAAGLDMPKSSAHRARRRLEEVLRVKLVDTDEVDDVWVELRELAIRRLP